MVYVENRLLAAYIQPGAGSFCDLKTQEWILKPNIEDPLGPKWVSKQTEKIIVKGGGRRAGGCPSGGEDVEISENDAKAAAIVSPVPG
jgi:hypothetical protein